MQANWETKKVSFALDELEVIGVNIDLDSTVMKEAAKQVVEKATEDDSGETATEDDVGEKKEEPANDQEESVSIWKRVKTFFSKTKKGVGES